MAALSCTSAILFSLIAASKAERQTDSNGHQFFQKDRRMSHEPNALLEGIMAAERFKSPQCLGARNDASMSNWMSMTSWTHQQVYVGKVKARLVASNLLGPGVSDIDDVDLMLVRNQKAASSSCESIFNQITNQSERYTQRYMEYRTTTGDCAADTNTSVIFTFVRDPMLTFSSGAIEVICRRATFSEAASHENAGKSVVIASRLAAAGWRNVQGGDAHDLFSAFLEDIEHLRYLGSDAFHAWPQALKVDVQGISPCISFIGLVSTLNASYAAVLPKVDDLMFELHKNKDGADAGKDVVECRRSLKGVLHWTSEQKKRICRLLAVDYACLNFQPPPECSI